MKHFFIYNLAEESCIHSNLLLEKNAFSFQISLFIHTILQLDILFIWYLCVKWTSYVCETL